MIDRMMENLLVPYQAVAEISGSSVLVLAPHPDDEVFGCGGAIMRHVDRGVPVRVAVVSDGGHGVSDENLAAYILQRQSESVAAAKVLGYGVPIFWHYRDREIQYGEKLVQEILAAIGNAGADLMYAPSIFEIHPDHRALGMAAVEAVRRRGKGLRLALYEVGMPLRPNQLLDISNLAERKMAAMKCFVSQNEKQRYDLDIAALNRYRTYTLPASVTAAEAYILVTAEELAKDPLKLYQSEHDRQKELGLRLDSRDTPLISVIVRSMDRATLSEALDSIAMQTYDNVEVVLVNAKGGSHTEFGEYCGRFPVRIVNQNGDPLLRAPAANAGLDAARGEYLALLDDDDTLDPDHFSHLVEAIKKEGNAVVAYAGVRCVDRNDPERKVFRIFNEPFEGIAKLLSGNFIPTHAPLFPRHLLKGARFDETMDAYEDWDFWLQVARVARFIHIDRVTATYFTGGTSGVSPIDANPDALQRAGWRLYSKWKNLITPDELKSLGFLYRRSQADLLVSKARGDECTIVRDALIEERDALRAERSGLIEERSGLIEERSGLIEERSGLIEERSWLIEERNGLIEERNGLIEERNGLNAGIEALRTALDAVLNSTSWKLTAPLRGVAIRGRRIKRLLNNSTRALLREPSLILPTFRLARRAFAASGWRGAAAAFRDIRKNIDNNRDCNYLWRCYRRDVERTIPDWREETRRLARHPKISVIIPSYETPTSILREAINSVLAQVYSEWELIIADDASPSPRVLQVVNEYVTQDSRIQSLPGLTNCGVSATSNRAIAAATGEFVVLLDHDDKLEPHALLRVAQSIVSDDPDFVYSDETLLTEDGTGVVDFVFRPAFSLELLRSHPYLVHLVGFRTRLLREIGGFDEKLRISQDYDLILRVCERARTVVHLPELLYCWRQNSSSAGNVRKEQVTNVSRSIIDAHLKRCGEDAYVEQGKIFNFYDVRYRRDPGIRVAIIIPTKNCGDLVRQCIESIERTVTEVAYHIVLVDHQSDESASINYFNSLQPRCTVLRYAGVFNFSAINNWATAQLGGEFTHYLYCNNDIEAIEPGWLERMVELAQKPDVGIVGATLLYPGRHHIQHGGVTLGLFGIAEHNGKFWARYLPDGRFFPGYRGALVANHEISAVTGACLLMRKDAFLKVGGYDEKLAVGFGDVDLCLRVRSAGYRVLLCPNAVLVHDESYTRGKSKTDPHPVDSAFFLARWQNFIDSGDPFYNPNLFIHSTAWEFNSPLPVSVAGCRRITRLDGLKETSTSTLSGPK